MNGETAERECSWYLKFNSHPHIIHTFGFVGNNDRLPMLLQERATQGNLQTLLQGKRFQPSVDDLIEIFLQILDAMIYLAGQGIVHGDLRCANVLVMSSSNILVKLTNFASAGTEDSPFIDTRQTSISVRYCAPAILKSIDQTNYSTASDVYSFGVLMWEACSQGKVPYGSRTNDDDIRRRRLNNEKLPQPNGCNDQIWTIIERCLYHTPEMRDTMEEIQTNILQIDRE
jgi:serine/threonine protein kinase